MKILYEEDFDTMDEWLTWTVEFYKDRFGVERVQDIPVRYANDVREDIHELLGARS